MPTTISQSTLDELAAFEHADRPHWRLYINDSGDPVVICVQWFDYPDYDARRFLSDKEYETEADAESALQAALDWYDAS